MCKLLAQMLGVLMYAFCSCGICEQLAAAESPVEDNWPFQYSFPGKLFPSQAYIATFSKSLSFIWKGSSSVNVTMISVSPNFWPSTRSEFADEDCSFSAFRGGIHENSTCLTCGMAFKFDNFWSVTSNACKYSGIWNDEKLHDIKKSVRLVYLPSVVWKCEIHEVECHYKIQRY